MIRIGVVGATTWGTTLSLIFARRGMPVSLLTRTEAEASRLRTDRQNRRFVPGQEFPAELSVTASPQEALGRARLVIIAVPSRTLRASARAIAPHLGRGAIVISATKGLELDTGKRMSQVLLEELPHEFGDRVCALSGPNLALEIVEGKPCSTVIASPNEEAAKEAQAHLTSQRFRVYTNLDIVGVELGGALKNIIAIGAGICDGLKYGDNAKAGFITRGLTEMARLAVAAGANTLTLAGLAGIGDLVATCFSGLSRNHYVGEQVATGRSLAEIRASMKNVAEGVDTTAAAVKLANTLGVEMPITRATYEVLFNNLALHQAIADLLGRAPSPEWVSANAPSQG